GNTTSRGGYLHYRFTKASSFGTADAPLELGDNGGFAVRDNWTNWTNPVIISGSNAFIVSEYNNTLASNGAWSGDGDVELRNLALTLAAPLDEFSGTIKFSAAAANSDSKQTRATSPIVSGSALTTGSAATYALWRAADGGNEESTLNVTLQFKGTGAAYDVHIGDLVSFSQLTGSAAMKSGDAENSRGLVANNTANSTANLIVGSANHAYSEFAERIADSGILDNTGAITSVQSGAKVAVTKVGTGTWALTGSNSYSGSTTVSGGVLLIDGAGSINSSSRIAVSGGELAVNSSVVLTPMVTVGTGGALTGSGTLGGAVEFDDATGTVSGGGLGTVGTLTFTDAQYWDDFTYIWDILDPSTYDKLSFTNSAGLDLVGENYTLTVNNPNAVTFENLAIISGLIKDFDESKWQLGEGFSLSYDNQALFLSYSIPEPSTWLLLGAGATLLVFLRRRR
ncbi:MAG: autotransporter-associated beta strand repeat-containing protein, partial [Verrucomicrobiales bacterium]|nr:autotransporter-associated beta strand repeat-containing protein [Verrucomicrobiales bacterium]